MPRSDVRTQAWAERIARIATQESDRVYTAQDVRAIMEAWKILHYSRKAAK
jgi:hypothetical protein